MKNDIIDYYKLAVVVEKTLSSWFDVKFVSLSRLQCVYNRVSVKNREYIRKWCHKFAYHLLTKFSWAQTQFMSYLNRRLLLCLRVVYYSLWINFIIRNYRELKWDCYGCLCIFYRMGGLRSFTKAKKVNTNHKNRHTRFFDDFD